ncbi:MAG: hypothetical protein ACRDG4_01745, partial [Chloroflexota bacterium]
MTLQARNPLDCSPPTAVGAAVDRATPRFEGFDPPESNFWRLPNNWFDLVAGFTSWAEHKVVEYILRHTWGYNEYGVTKLITMDEFMHGRKRRDGSRMDAGCGMAENSIKKGISDAVAHGFLVVEIDARDRGRIRKFYAPRMRGTQPIDDSIHAQPPRGQFSIPEGQTLTPRPQLLPLSRQFVTAPDQELTPSPPSADPRTGQTATDNTTKQHDQTYNMRALPLVPGGRSKVISPPTPQTKGEAPLSGNENHLTTLQPQRKSSLAAVNADLARDLTARLVDQGIAPTRAAALARSMPTERIERQLAWIDRRRFRNRAATLIRAIEDDFAAPPAHRAGDNSGTSFDPGKFYRGAYAVCPRCGARPCAP